MADRRQLLNNRSLRFGPSSLAGLIVRADSRALVLGRALDLSDMARLNDYFDFVIAEDPTYLAATLPTTPDVVVWNRESVYEDSAFALASDITSAIFAIRWESMVELEKLSKDTGLYQIGYLAGGDVSTTPAEVRSIAAGLAENAPGVHLAKIVGCLTVYDTEGRAGTVTATTASIQTMLDDKDKYGISAFWLGANRPTVAEKL